MDNTYVIKYERFDDFAGNVTTEEMRVVNDKVETVINSLLQNHYKILAVLVWCPPI